MLERVFETPKFRVYCLGALKLVEAGSGTDMTPASRKTRALLGYLCAVRKPVGRERLASLLWGDRGEEQARASLRQAIYELRSVLGGNHLLEVERDTVAIGNGVGTDVAAIATAAQSGDLEQLGHALSEWRGDFFEDLHSIDPSFDAWLQTERLRVRERLVDAVTEAVKAGMARGEIEPARKIVSLVEQRDDTNDVILRLGLRLDHLAGDSATLHRRYGRFRELLKSELDAAPAVNTQRLFQELASGLSAVPTGSVSGGSVADGINEHVQQSGQNGTSNSVPFLAQSVTEAATETRVLRLPFRSGHRIGVTAVTLLVASLCALIWSIWSPLHKVAPSSQKPLVAVLPFQNLSAEQGSDFSEGIGEEIASALQKTQIRVARSNLGFQNTSAPTPLAATHVLSGSVERVGNRIHVIAQLTDILGDLAVWSHAYEEGITETPRLRRSVAVQIADAVDKLLSSTSFGNVQNVSPTAYNYYLKGRALFRQHYPRAAAAELDESVRLAPDFAQAWSALAAARWLLATSTLIEHRGDYDPSTARAARVAAGRALALDRINGQALGVLALLTPPAHLQEIDRLLERALRSEPHNPQLLGWHGEFLMFVGRNHEALDELTRAYELDNATPSVTSNLVLVCLKTGRFEEAKEIIDLIDVGRDKNSRAAFLHLHVKYFLYMRDWFRLANYLRVLRADLSPRMAAFLNVSRETAIALATREVDKYAKLRVSWRTETTVDPDDAVQFLFALGDANGALAAITSVVESRRKDELLTDPEWEALFDLNLLTLRRDPRVPALFADWGLTDYWRTANHWPDFIR